MFRYADKPIRSSPGILSSLGAEWLAQLKMDGWRTLIDWDGHAVNLTSRHRSPIPASPELRRSLASMLHELPPLSLDGEYMGRRDKQPEGVYLFDLLAINGQWIGGRSCLSRWEYLNSLVAPVLAEPVRIVEARLDNYAEFFERSKRMPGCEGIVLKHVASRFLGSTRACAENPQWIKVKFREGADGQSRVA